MTNCKTLSLPALCYVLLVADTWQWFVVGWRASITVLQCQCCTLHSSFQSLWTTEVTSEVPSVHPTLCMQTAFFYSPQCFSWSSWKVCNCHEIQENGKYFSSSLSFYTVQALNSLGFGSVVSFKHKNLLGTSSSYLMTPHGKHFHKGFKLLVTQGYVTWIKINLLSTLLSSKGAIINNILVNIYPVLPWSICLSVSQKL